MNIIDNLRKNILYFFTSLPFVIVIYEILMTLTLGNTGYAVLLFGQLAFVPILIALSSILFAFQFADNIFAILSLIAVLSGIIYGIYYAVKK
jgi:hypothetical protein